MNELIIIGAKYLFILVVIGLIAAVVFVKKDIRVRFVLSILVGAAIAYGLSRLAARLHYDPRPFVTEHITPLVPHANDNGFPSDHALFTMMMTVAVAFFSRKIALAMLILTIIVGVSRILAHVHSPLDIGAGWVIGAIGSIAGYYIIGLFYRKKASISFTTE